MKKLLAVLCLMVLPSLLFAADPVKNKADFDKTVKLYTMDEALKVGVQTGKPVFCWMGEGIFESESNRAASVFLKDTTIQAVMDADGTEADKLGFRLKFSSNSYKDNSKVYNLRAENFTKEKLEEALRIARGGEPTSRVREIK